MTTTLPLAAHDTTGAALGGSSAAALGVGESYGHHRQLYEQLYGKACYDSSTHALTVRTNRIRALMLPRPLGLVVLGQRPWPVFSTGNGLILVFLTAPPTPDDDVARCDAALFKAAVTTVGPGAELALPTPGHIRRQWLRDLPNETTCLPPYLEVVNAVLGACRG